MPEPEVRNEVANSLRGRMRRQGIKFTQGFHSQRLLRPVRQGAILS
jgi:hypothetical protein